MYQMGLGDPDPPCSSFFSDPSILNPECVAVTWDYYFGNPQQKAAAVGVVAPTSVYEPILAPPAPSAPAIDPNTGEPVNGDYASGDVLAAQMAAWQAQNQNTMNQTAANLDAAGNSSNLPSIANPFSSIPTWLWAVLIGGGALLLVGVVRR